MKIKCIIFDLDDTLIVEEASAIDAIIAAAKAAHKKYSLDPVEFQTTLHEKAKDLWYNHCPARQYCIDIGISSWEGLWANYTTDNPNVKIMKQWMPTYRLQSWTNALTHYGINDPELAQIMADDYPKQRRQRHFVFDDAIETLENLRKNYKLALISNGISCLQREKIQGTNVGQYFDEIIISGDIGTRKPYPKIFQTLLDRLELKPNEVIMVGNSLGSDIAGAQNMNIKAVWIPRGHFHPDENAKPDHKIHSLKQIPDYLESLERQSKK